MVSKTTSKKTIKDEPKINIIKDATCQTSSGKSTLGYQVGIDESGATVLSIRYNSGGGFFSNREWIAYDDIRNTIDTADNPESIKSLNFRKLYKGKSANNPGFLVAVLVAEGILERVPEKKRVHQAGDPGPFLASVEALSEGTSSSPKAKAKRKAPAKAKTKAPAKAKASSRPTAKTPRKSPARSKKAS